MSPSSDICGAKANNGDICSEPAGHTGNHISFGSNLTHAWGCDF